MAAYARKLPNKALRGAISRRELLAGSVAAGGMAALGGGPAAAAESEKKKKTFTILHTNDLHSNLIGMARPRTTRRSRSTTTRRAAGSRVWPR